VSKKILYKLIEKKKQDAQVLVSRTGLIPETSARLIYPSLLLAPLPEVPAPAPALALAGRIHRARHHTHVSGFPSLAVLAFPKQ
jgi:hypothetical protein